MTNLKGKNTEKAHILAGYVKSTLEKSLQIEDWRYDYLIKAIKIIFNFCKLRLLM